MGGGALAGAPRGGESLTRMAKPRLAIVSIGIRRDLLAPLRFFNHLEIVHLYKKSVYDDLTADDLNSKLIAYSSPLDLRRKLVAAQPNVIQGVEPFSFYTQPYVWACYAAAGKLRAKLIAVTLENRPLETKFGSVRASVLRQALRTYFARACLIIALNRGAQENLQPSGVAPERIERALWGVWGVDTDEFCPAEPNAAPTQPTILFVGRLDAEKGVFVLLDAFETVARAHPAARLWLVGDGAARSEIQERIRARGLLDSVTLTGTIKHRDLPPLFRRAAIFCAPSLTTRKWAEQVGAAILQAMASGLPVVATASGAIPEYLPDGRAGILVPERDPEALAAALAQLLGHPAQARAMGSFGREYACAHYDARKNIAHAEQLVMEHCLARGI